MPTSRAKPKRHSKARTPQGSKPSQNATRRKSRVARTQPAKKKATVKQPAKRKAKQVDTLPGWGDLVEQNERKTKRSPIGRDKVSTAKFGLVLLVVALLGTLYVGHVQATQDVLARVQQARKDNLRLHLKYTRLKGEFDRVTGPGVIYQRARELGLEEDIAYGPTIRVSEP